MKAAYISNNRPSFSTVDKNPLGKFETFISIDQHARNRTQRWPSSIQLGRLIENDEDEADVAEPCYRNCSLSAPIQHRTL